MDYMNVMAKNDTRQGKTPSSGLRGFSSRDEGTGRFTEAKLPPTFRVHVSDSRSFSVVRRDVMDGALGRSADKFKK